MARKKKNLIVEDAEISENSAEQNEATLNSDELSLSASAQEQNLNHDSEDTLTSFEENSDTQADLSDDLSESEDFDVQSEASIFLSEEEEGESFLPEAQDEDVAELEAAEESEVSVEGTELDAFDSADIEDVEFVEMERLESIVESVLFASDRPVSLASLKVLFKGTNIRGSHLKNVLDQLAVEYAGGRRGVTLEEVPGGYPTSNKN